MTIAHIYNGELGFDVRTKLNALIDQVAALPVGGGTGDVTGPAGALADAVAVYNGVTGKLIKDGGATIANIIASAVAASGTGDVVGPASAVNSQIAVFNGVTGKLIADGGMTIADVIATAGGGGAAIGGVITGATAGSVLFAGVGGILAQDNTNFFWDDATDILKLAGELDFQSATATIKVGGTTRLDYGVATAGHWTSNASLNLATSAMTYDIATYPALYVVPHVTRNNWFEGNSGSVAVTGYGNFGTGDLALSGLTSGYDNVGVGSSALLSLQTGYNNFALGSNALRRTLGDYDNIGLGYNALATLGDLGAGGGTNTRNIAIGFGAFVNLKIGSSNTAIGFGTMGNVKLATTAVNNTVVGANAGINIGLAAPASVDFNTLIGYNAGGSLTGGLRNVFLGSWAGPAASVNDVIALSNGTGLLDMNATTNWCWSFSHRGYNLPTAIHVYNTQSALGVATNYERAIFDWVGVSNVLRIGVQAAGTGTVRPIRWVGLSAKATPVAADSLLMLDSASSGDMKTVLISTLPGGGGGMAIGGAVTGGTTGSILYVDSGNLAQQNTNLFFDDANNALKIGSNHTYNIDTFRALYRVPHASGDNWFEGDAGNPSVTGYENFGTGGECMMSLTTGTGNTGIGHGALRNLTTGGANFAFGKDALRALTTGSNNVGVGPNALQSGTATQNNVGIGSLGVMQNLGNPFSGGAAEAYNVAIGAGSFQSLIVANQNTALGALIGTNITVADGNTMIGFGSGNNIYGGAYYDNTFIGKYSGGSLSGAQNCTVIGEWAGPGASLSNIIVINDGRPFVAAPRMDFNYTNANFWTIDRGLGFALQGGTSGTVKILTKAVAGTWTMTLPDSAGTSGYVLSTDGAGVTSWAAAGGGGGMAIGGAITGGTAGRVLFAGVGGVLDDDSTFTWNDSLKDLAIGGAYYVNAARALYVVPHVTENNWFEGNAGNQTLSGYGNFATGDLALSSLTSGSSNVGMGSSAGKLLTTGSGNFALGSFSMWFGQADSNNVGIGYLTLATLGIGGAGGGNNSGNVAIGYSAFSNTEQGVGNIAIGYAALNSVFAPSQALRNTIIGSSAGNNLGVGGGGNVENNTFIGPNAGLNLTGAAVHNTYIGGYRGPSAAGLGRTIAISDGSGSRFLMDCNLTTAWAWSFSTDVSNDIPIPLHLYNHQDAYATPTNYERAILDWQLTTNVFRIGVQIAGTGVRRIIAIDGFPKAGAPAAADLPASTWSVIDDTSAGQTWLVFNKAGTIRKVQLT